MKCLQCEHEYNEAIEDKDDYLHRHSRHFNYSWKDHFCSIKCLEIYEAFNGKIEFCNFCGKTVKYPFTVCDTCKLLNKTVFNPKGDDIGIHLKGTKNKMDFLME